MNATFVHTADWQLGKPFAGAEDVQKRSLLQNERLAVIKRIAEKTKEHGATFVLVAGDLFDSPNATKATVSAACSAIGAIGVPVFAIPGNHDHGGPGSLWTQEFFQRERDALASNFQVLLKPEPVELEQAVLFPCPLLRRHETADPTAWLRTFSSMDERFGNKPRIVLAHGSVLNFGSLPDDEESETGASNLLDLQRLPEAEFDYIALGDWHGAKQVAPKAWYSGTPELDRFVKGDEHNPGNILVVKTGRGQLPQIECVRSGAMGWHEVSFTFAGDQDLARLREQVNQQVGNRANQDLLWLHLSGSLGIEVATELDRSIEAWNARLLRVKLDNQVTIVPSPAELEGLTQRAGDPLVARVAAKLVALASAEGEQAVLSRLGLRELYAAIKAR
jgi:DNA repair exonuclease SbcCD nuclease subunit